MRAFTALSFLHLNLNQLPHSAFLYHRLPLQVVIPNEPDNLLFLSGFFALMNTVGFGNYCGSEANDVNGSHRMAHHHLLLITTSRREYHFAEL